MAVALAASLVSCGGGDDDAARDEGAADEAPTTESAPATTPPAATPAGVCWTAPAAGGAGVAFADATAAAGLVDPLTGMHGHAAAAADVDGDGWTDLFVGGFADRPADEYRERGAAGPSPDRLLRGGPGGFTVDDTFPGEPARTSGAAFADLDADGDLDLVVVRNPRPDGEIASRPTTVYRNDGGAWTAATTLLPDTSARSVAALDVDRDGLADLAIAGDRFGEGSTRLLRNTGGLEFEDAVRRLGPAGRRARPGARPRRPRRRRLARPGGQRRPARCCAAGPKGSASSTSPSWPGRPTATRTTPRGSPSATSTATAGPTWPSGNTSTPPSTAGAGCRCACSSTAPRPAPSTSWT